MLRRLALNGLVLGSFFISMAAQAVEVPGKVIYKMPAGELVRRDVSLDVPPRGQGKVLWKTAHHTLESHAFKTKKHLGRTIFSVVFLNVPGAPKNTAMALVGTYLRGTNEVIYYGDIYSKICEETPSADVVDEVLAQVTGGADTSGDEENAWNFSGGFKFGKELTP
jgi:hypothetical protein